LIRLSTRFQNIPVWNWKKKKRYGLKKDREKLEVNIKLCANLYWFFNWSILLVNVDFFLCDLWTSLLCAVYSNINLKNQAQKSISIVLHKPRKYLWFQ
jgi:hypothetical protein